VRRHCDGRRTHFLSGARPWPNRRAVGNQRRHFVRVQLEFGATAMESSSLRKSPPVSALFDRKIVVPSIASALVKLDPRTLIKNPVMFVLEIVTALTTVIMIRVLFPGGGPILFQFQIILWLWFPVLFANFAEAVAEGRGQAQADTLRRPRAETPAKLLSAPGDSRK